MIADSVLAPYRMRCGAYGSCEMDLFPTFAAIAGLRILGEDPRHPDATARAITGRGTRRGVGSARGQQPDAWATGYACMVLFTLGLPVPDSWCRFLTECRMDGGYGMRPGEPPDVWATAFCVNSLATSTDAPVPDMDRTIEWLASCRTSGGGFSWSPEWAQRDKPDMRATSFAMQVLAASGTISSSWSRLDLAQTVAWINTQQVSGSGFRLNARNASPCVWACGEATKALTILGSRPVDTAGCIEFIHRSRRDDGGFARGPAYAQTSDVWATSHAVRALNRLGVPLDAGDAANTASFLHSCGLPIGGYVYRPPLDAADVLSTASAVMAGVRNNERAVLFLTNSTMPGEGGVAYQPARGSEARAAQWTVAALRRAGVSTESGNLIRWASNAQHPDGGFGPWEGRASTPSSTYAVISAIDAADAPLKSAINVPEAQAWINQAWSALWKAADRDRDLIDAVSIFRTAGLLGIDTFDEPMRELFATHMRGSAWRRTLRHHPDLLATYAALVAGQQLGTAPVVPLPTLAWVESLKSADGAVAWSRAATGSGGPLAAGLANLITLAAVDGVTLPDLIL
ncbi:MAG: prenyltransferase/squalene oxidase repeat-containing protein [Actinomycetota bacterium]